ncbi:hypothetical protein ACWOES_08530 [Dolosigranulum pigrum]|nr:MAG TPA: hypothetical protein [Bacteriophage sp.]
MYKLIESNGKEMKEVLSDGKVLWSAEGSSNKHYVVELPEYEEYEVTIDLTADGNYLYINNIPDAFGGRHREDYISTTKFKKIFSHMEILGVKFDISPATSSYYSNFSKRITMQYAMIKNALKKAGWTVFNNKIKLYYKENSATKRVGRRLTVVRNNSQIAILGASDIDFRYFEIGNTGVLKRQTALSTTKAIVVTDTTKAKSVIDEFNIEDSAEEKIDVIFYLN